MNHRPKMFIDALPALALALACVISVDGFADEGLRYSGG
jgi:hypothetical protein